MINPQYEGTYYFANDFAALLPDTPDFEGDASGKGLMRLRAEKGLSRVLIFSPRHDLTLPKMDQQTLENVVQLWVDQSVELANIDYINHIQIFENKGEK